MTHGQMVNACMDLLEALRLNGLPVIASKTATVRAKLETGRYIDTGREGHADITACICGEYVQIECKVGRDKQRDGQQDMERYVKSAGGVYLLVNELQVIRDYLRARGLLTVKWEPKNRLGLCMESRVTK